MVQPTKVSVDLAPYPDLVVVYLGFRARGLSGLRRMMSLGAGFRSIKESPPDGLLRHEFFLWGWMHVGIRQYWRDLQTLEAFTRSAPHSGWWRDFGRGAGGAAGFWHETYSRTGGIEGCTSICRRWVWRPLLSRARRRAISRLRGSASWPRARCRDAT